MPIRIASFWTRDDTAPFSLGVRFLTRPGWQLWTWAQWSHQGVMFEFPDGSTVIHEALLSDGWCSKGGARLAQWLSRSPRHYAEVHWLPIAPETVAAIYQRSCGWLGTASYAWKQIIAFAVAESIVGRWLGLSLKSGPEELICSEGACILLGMAGDAWDLRECRDQSWDSVSPQAAYDAFLRKLIQ